MNLYSLKTLNKYGIISACFINKQINIEIAKVLDKSDLSGLGEIVKPFILEREYRDIEIIPENVTWCDIQIDDDGEEYEDGIVIECKTQFINRNISIYFFVTGEMHHYEFE